MSINNNMSLKRVYQCYGVIFLAVTLLINIFIPLCLMCTGMFSMHGITMKSAAQAAEQYIAETGNIYQTDNIKIYTDWHSAPEQVKSITDGIIPTEINEVQYQHCHGEFIDALMVYQQKSGENLYVWLNYNATHDLEFAPKNMAAIVLLITMTFGVVASLALHLQRRVISPVHQISRAIKQHDWQKMQRLHFPQQCYAELQSIVDALDISIKQLKDAQQRELSFLRFASHELRTPIAICQSSFDILTLQHGQLEGPILHASQATRQMKSITETLLWLMSSECTSMQYSEIKLADLLQQVISDQQAAKGDYLPIELLCDETVISVQRDPLTIILNNLVRNSLEHGTEGVIIRQSNSKIEIINSMSPHNSSGFGLGLMLVERLAKQLNWNYYSTRDNNQFCARINILN
ncbi:histidine kinase A domain protein domain protein [Shewanella halifaxensis HAW-EB4]|uniref:histidine kinase n=1 Tax=Shewanella halifaxensis (strain HAW-EB4) TaxID=458817 RepID=B0TMP0_SHEHH|nr:HAMP domain-containing sensor histidine kinase [Shewanella halifaxensis]ABZ77400.1 histidine kinase A domain protein domain protein [Shewanella halifaxensis HAW-EB4]